VTKPQFVYVIYIRATAEEVWNGLVDPAHALVLDARQHFRLEARLAVDPQTQRRDRSGRDRRRGCRKRSAKAPGADVGAAKRCGKPRRDQSRQLRAGARKLAWRPMGAARVVHTDLEPDSEMFHSVSYGWPALMSGLKTLLEHRRFEKTS
jgi:hypothetical protein